MRKYLALLFLLSCLHVATRGQTLEEVDLSSLPQPTQAQALRYWFDDDASSAQTTNDITGSYSLDVSALQEGLHTLHCQIIDNENKATPVCSSFFLKVGDSGNTKAKHLCYWFDDETTIQTLEISGGVQLLDASALTEGLHSFHYQVLCNNGMMTPAMSTIFMKLGESSLAITAKGFRYWFDNDASSVKTIDGFNSPMIIDASNLVTGLHTIYYQIIDSNDKVGTPVARIFFKDFDILTADGQNRIIKYQYWQNDNSSDMETVTLDNAANPYQMFGLLPMQSKPIRSSCFHFEVNDGVPRICAKNIFRVRFHDARGYFTDSNCSYVDYSVTQDITNLQVLESGVRMTMAKPTGNEIKWLTLEAEPGDSLQFKLDRAATIQLFAPSGKEVYRAAGAESVSWGGCHTAESGAFYLALHDVTATNGSEISIDYEHIDKYAVLRQDVSFVGNGGCSTITFEGNGYKDLYGVDLIDGNGNTIEHVYIGHESDATTSVVFDFTDAVLGVYDAVFHFTEEDKVFENLVTVEEARDIEIDVDVTHSSAFLAGTAANYIIKVTNKGNMTAYTVPLEIRISADQIQNVKINGFLQGLSVPQELLDGSIDKEYIDLLNSHCQDADNRALFIIEDNDGKEQGILNSLLTIPPNSTEIIHLTPICDGVITCYAYSHKHADPISISEGKVKMGNNSSPNRDYWCCIKDALECSADLIAKGVNMAMPPSLQGLVLTCGLSFVKTGLETWFDVWCTDGADMTERFKNYLSSKGDILTNRLLNDAISCVTKNMCDKLKNLGDQKVEAAAVGDVEKVNNLIKDINNTRNIYYGALNTIYTGLSNIGLGVFCYNGLKKILSGCSEEPTGGGGISTPVTSMDPNDIYGYTAESGSKAVKEGLTDVYYRIEFENDPEQATAAAQEIRVTDELDATKFDLSTFKPTRIKIGNKSAELSGDKNFVTTIDMRPEIYAIAQVEGTFDEKTGIVQWHITSLDPMTMEPTEDPLAGVLPVNDNGNGIGELSFDICLKEGLAHETEVTNSASIVFDTNEAIETPVWTNVIDLGKPTSHVKDVQQKDGKTAIVSIEADDDLSGAWRYDVYVQYGSGAWFKGAENVPIDEDAEVAIYAGIEHKFYTIVTDYAGNVEQKEPLAESTLTPEAVKGDVNGDGDVDIADAVCIVNHVVGKATPSFVAAAADVNGDGDVDIADAVRIVNLVVGKIDALARRRQTSLPEPE